MIEPLQIIILLPLMNVQLPANTGRFFSQLTAIAAFDIFETDEYLRELFDLPPQDPVNQNFETIGFETVYFLNNLGSFILVFVVKLLLILIWAALYPLARCSKRFSKLRGKLGRRIFWNS